MQALYPGQIGIWIVGFVGGGKLDNPEKNPWSKARTNNKLNPEMAPGCNQTHHCAIPAPLALRKIVSGPVYSVFEFLVIFVGVKIKTVFPRFGVHLMTVKTVLAILCFFTKRINPRSLG